MLEFQEQNPYCNVEGDGGRRRRDERARRLFASRQVPQRDLSLSLSPPRILSSRPAEYRNATCSAYTFERQVRMMYTSSSAGARRRRRASACPQRDGIWTRACFVLTQLETYHESTSFSKGFHQVWEMTKSGVKTAADLTLILQALSLSQNSNKYSPMCCLVGRVCECVPDDVLDRVASARGFHRRRHQRLRSLVAPLFSFFPRVARSFSRGENGVARAPRALPRVSEKV